MQKIYSRAATLSDMAKTIAIPSDYPPHRMPTFPALERTAVLSFTDTASAEWPVAVSSSNFVLTRDPAYPLWAIKYINSAASQYGFASSFGVSVGISANDTDSLTIGDVLPTVSSGEMEALKYPVLKSEGKSFFLLGAESISGAYPPVGAVSVETTAGGVFKMSIVATMLDEYFNQQQIDFGAASPTVVGAIASLTLQFPLNAIGFRVESITLQAGPSGLTYTTCAVGVSTGSSSNPLYSPGVPAIYRLLPYGTPPESTTATLIWQNTRCTASSLLLSNVTAVMNKEGTVNGARVNVQSFPAFRPLNWAGFNAIHPADRYFGALENGIYAFTLPDVSSEDFRDCVLNTAGAVLVGAIDLGGLRYATCLQLIDLNIATNTTMALTLTRHTEFRTTSRLFPTTFAKESLETYHASQMALVSMGTIMENPTHLTAIARMTDRAVRTVAPKGGKQPKVKPAKKSNQLAGKMTQKSMVAPPSESKRKSKPPPKKGKK